jgi:hypothetical protein
MSEVHCETIKKLRRIIHKTRRGMLTSGVALLNDSARPHTSTAARTRVLLQRFNWNCLTILLTALISLRATTTCLLVPTWRTGCDHRASTIMSWWNVSKLGWALGRQTSLTLAHKNLFPDTSASISVVTMLRNSLSMYVFFVYNKLFSHSLFC